MLRYLKWWLFSYGPRGGILTIGNLVKNNLPLVNWCCLCRCEEETVDHFIAPL